MNNPLVDCSLCANEQGEIVPGGCCGFHAEQKAILDFLLKIHKTPQSTMSIASTYSPCTTCANWILATGFFHRCFYLIETEHDMRGIKLLEAGGITCVSVA